MNADMPILPSIPVRAASRLVLLADDGCLFFLPMQLWLVLMPVAGAHRAEGAGRGQ